jgi:small subunit ribosomal protein S8
MTDPIADMLTIILNGQAVSKETVELPFSKFKFEVAKILEKNGFLGKVEKKGKKDKSMEITLRYEDKAPVMMGLKRASKPGQRIYSEFKHMKKVKGGFGISIVSTSRGLMTNKEAWKQRLGGEIICEVW